MLLLTPMLLDVVRLVADALRRADKRVVVLLAVVLLNLTWPIRDKLLRAEVGATILVQIV